ncbi:MAG: hypothetical protein R3C16_12380 [Hyphomonadaceae bacterium]
MVTALLGLVLGLPIALVSGIAFSLIALAPRRVGGDEVLADRTFGGDVQPFR